MRILHPELVVQAIASCDARAAVCLHAIDPIYVLSCGADHSILGMSQVIRLSAPPDCVQRIEKNIKLVDDVLDVQLLLRRPPKVLFALTDPVQDDDFVYALAAPPDGKASPVFFA